VTTAPHLLERLKELGVRLWVEGNELCFDAPEGAIGDQQKSDMARLKMEIIGHLAAETKHWPDLPTKTEAPAEVGPLSSAQEQFWFHEHLAGPSSLYNIPAAIEVHGKLDSALLAASVDVVVRRHPALRVFIPEGNPPQQRINRSTAIQLRLEDLTHCPPECRRQTALDLIRAEARRPFDLRRGPLFRPVHWRLSDIHHFVQLTTHHIISDGRSTEIIISDLLAAYQAIQSDCPLAEPKSTTSFFDYCRWQRTMAEQGGSLSQTGYWRQKLQGAPAQTSLPTVAQRPKIQSYRGAVEKLALSAAVVSQIEQLARRHRTTPFAVYLAAWAATISGFSGQKDCVLGFLNSNRTPETEHLVGLFVNALPIRLELSHDLDFDSLIDATHATFVEALSNGDLSFAQIVDAVQPARTLSHNPIFQILLVFATPRPPDTMLPGSTIDRINADEEKAKFDLTLFVTSDDRSADLALEYNCDLFDGDAARRLLSGFSAVLESTITHPATRLGSIPLMNAVDRTMVLREWNDTARDYDLSRCLHHLIEAQVERSPGQVAVVADGGHTTMLTYQALDQRACRLADELRGMGAGPGSFVAVFMDRVPDLIVGLYAILKTGAGFVPIDPSYPIARVAFILRDANTPVLITQSQFVARLGELRTAVICLDRYRPENDAPVQRSTAQRVAAGDPAYLIYTSGSTGEPKGAINSHRAICNRLLWMQESYALTPRDTVLAKTPIGFDVALWELFWPLICGARLVLAQPNGHRDPDYLMKAIVRHDVSTLHFVPSMLRMFIRSDDTSGLSECGKRLKRIICSGEALASDLRDNVFAALPDVELYNLYGPSEAAIDVTAWQCRRDDRRPFVPIGRPIANTQIYILDDSKQPMPPGTAGELYIGGVNVGLGYWKREDLTRQRFIPDPFSGKPSATLFRTGDRARHLPDGTIEFLGRIDDQVKIRGQRVEPSEVEAVMRCHPAVRDVAVIPVGDESGVLSLAAYWVPTAQATSVPDASIRAHLRQQLPEFMVPAAILRVDDIPVTANGKRDRASLASRSASIAQTGETAAARQPDRLEEILLEVWQQVLGRKEIGHDEAFFDVGGDSIRVIELVYRARTLGLRLTVEDVFRHQTIRELTAVAEPSGMRPEDEVRCIDAFALISEADRAALPADVEDAYPLTMLQSGLIYQSLTDPRYKCYVTSLRLQGQFHRSLLESAIVDTIARHPVMRVSFDLGGYSEPLQLVHRNVESALVVFDVSRLPREEQTDQIAAWLEAARETQFDWNRPQLFRFFAHLLDEGTFQLTLVEPVLDGWSVAVLLTELVSKYAERIAENAMRRAQLPNRGRSGYRFSDFVALERRAVASSEQSRFWRTHLGDAPRTFLPRWPGARPPGPHYVRRQVDIDPAIQAALRSRARENAVPLKTALLAVHVRVVALLTGRSDVMTGLMSHGRPETTPASSHVGLFLNALPLRVLASGETWSDLLRAVHRAEAGTLAHRHFPYAQMVRDHGDPLFDTLFNFVHFYPYKALEEGPVRLLHTEAFDQTYFGLTAQFSVSWQTGDVGLRLDFNAEDFPTEQIDSICRYYKRALVLLARGVPVSTASDLLLTEEDSTTLSLRCIGPCRPLPDSKRFTDLFREQSSRTPDAVAVRDNDRSVSYGQLHDDAQSVACNLIAAGVTPGSVIALMANRNADTLRVMLGLFMAGAIYLPLDPDWPPARIAEVLRLSGCRWLLADTARDEAARRALAPHFWPDTPAPDLFAVEHWLRHSAHDDEALPEITGDAVCYILYTSGSSGRPKGAMVHHRGMLNHLLAKVEDLELTADSAVAQTARLTFDISIWQLLAPLLVGGRIEIVDSESAVEPRRLAQSVVSRGVTILEVVPSLLRVMIEDLADGRISTSDFDSLKWLIVTGEVFPADLYEKGRSLFPHMKIMNAYGPTECSDDVAHFASDGPLAAGLATVPIGRAIRNTDLVVVDALLRPVPVGTPGELLVGGICVGQGYLNDREQTDAAFIANPLPDRSSVDRMYRTGDLVRVIADGNLEFLGRLDHQIKLHGHRIELGEVEQHIRQAPGVRDAIVVKTATANRDRLLGYVVFESNSKASTATLYRYLRERLPQHWIPGQLIELPRLPTNANGKIDRSALPAMQDLRDRRAPFAPPQTEFQRWMTSLWENILKCEQLGIHDNFFDLGGDSLRAIQLVSRVAAATGIELPLRALLSAPSVAQYCTALEAASTVRASTPRKKLGTPEGQQGPHDHIKTESRSLLGLAVTDHFGKIDAAAIGYIPDVILAETGLTRQEIVADWFGGIPQIREVLRTPLGQLANITLPLFASDLYADKKSLLARLAESIELASRLGCRAVALTGLIPSATDYGLALATEMSNRTSGPTVTTGHAATAAAVALSVKNICAHAGGTLADERLGVLGVGSIGISALGLILRHLPHPTEIILCDLFGKRDVLSAVERWLRTEFGFTGKIETIISEGAAPAAFYRSSLIVGATNLPGVLDISALQAGTMIVDDSAPHCFDVGAAIDRLEHRADIMFTEGGFVGASHRISEIRYLPPARGGIDLFGRLHRFNRADNEIMGCVLSGLLQANFSDIPPTLGLASDNACEVTFQRLNQLEFGPAGLSCLHYRIADALIDRFRRSYGRENRSTPDEQRGG